MTLLIAVGIFVGVSVFVAERMFRCDDSQFIKGVGLFLPACLAVFTVAVSRSQWTASIPNGVLYFLFTILVTCGVLEVAVTHVQISKSPKKK